MPLMIRFDDITNIEVEVLVNSTNEQLDPSGGVDLKIHQMMGPKFSETIKDFKPLYIGESFIVDGSPFWKYILCLSAPVYSLNKMVERMLYITYHKALTLAYEHGAKSIAFPLVSAGFNGFPKDIAMRIAIHAIQDFLDAHEMEIYLVFLDRNDLDILSSIQKESLNQFILTQDKVDVRESSSLKKIRLTFENQEAISMQKDISFSHYLYELIQKKNLNEVNLYKKANIDRKLFSKIMTTPAYQPSKQTAILLALALTLTYEETQDFLSKAGFTLSNSITFDLVIHWCIKEKIYDVFEVSQILLDKGLKPLS